MSYELILGDCVQVMKGLRSESVQTCVTSPPYYGLRSYLDDDHPEKALEIGTEETPEAFVAKLVEVFREVRRLLKSDGTLWLNLASSYNGSGGAGGDYGVGGLKEGQPKYPGRHLSNYKPKDLIPIPWMVAMALQQDGYYLRSDIIWAKPDPMPESVSDRPTRSHEYIFLLSKSRTYYYDADAIREPQKESSLERLRNGWNGNKHRDDPSGHHNNFDRYMGKSDEEIAALPGRNKRDVWSVTTGGYEGAHYATFPPALIEPCILAGSKVGDTVLDPFFGSGTTGAVALKHHRDFIGIDLDSDNLELAHDRIRRSQPMLLSVP